VTSPTLEEDATVRERVRETMSYEIVYEMCVSLEWGKTERKDQRFSDAERESVSTRKRREQRTV